MLVFTHAMSSRYGDPRLNSELPKHICVVQSEKGYPARY